MIDYDALAADYSVHRRVHPGVLAELLSAIDTLHASHILEVGCGTGNYISAIAERRTVRCHGLEPSEGMLREARQRSANVELRVGRAEELPFESVFDFIFSVDVIHHVGDRPAYFRGAARALRPGGRICTVTDSEDIIRRREPLTRYFPDIVDVELRRYPAIAAIEEEMTLSGFMDIHQSRAEFSYSLSTADPFRDKVFSSLLLISDAAFAKGLARMERDLALGPIPCVSRYVLVWGARGARG